MCLCDVYNVSTREIPSINTYRYILHMHLIIIFFSHLVCVFSFTHSLFILCTEISLGIRIIHVSGPRAIENGKSTILTCEYDTENEGLYSVKWYKGTREFFRFTPKEIPAEKVFRFPGLNVNVSIFIFI